MLEKGLKERGYSKEWLLGEVQKQGAKDLKEVFLAQVDSRGNVYVDLYEGKEKTNPVNERPMVAATLKKTQADLEKFALKTDNPEAKKLYAEQAAKLQEVIDSILPYLK